MEGAGEQGKFWELYDSIAFSKRLPEMEDIKRIAKNIKLSTNDFDKDLINESIKDRLEDNFERLSDAGIYGTPTIMINNKLVYNSSSIKDIEQMLIEEINKFQ